MKIGLIRHFKVDHSPHYFLDSDGFVNSMHEYDTAPVIKNGLVINSGEWDLCLCSTLPRAKTTAQSIYNGDIEYTDLLVEVDMKPFTQKQITLPSFFWHIGARLHWYKGKTTQPEVRGKTIKRAENVLDKILGSGRQNILVVSHGFFLRSLVNILTQNGFDGKIDEAPRNAKLYIMNSKI